MRRKRTRQPLDYYLDLKYPVLVCEDKDGGYVAEIPDLPGCLTQAETLPELMEMIEDARRSWIQVAYDDGKEIPLPRTEVEYSGKFLVRVPASLHRRLAQASADEGISLNQYVMQLLTRKLDLEILLRRIDAVGSSVGAIERSVRYAIGPVSGSSKAR